MGSHTRSAYLECVLGTVARSPDPHSLQHARVAQLLQHQLIVKAQLSLKRHVSDQGRCPSLQVAGEGDL